MPDLADSASSSRTRTIAYWITTVVLATECVVGGVMGALRLPPFTGIIEHLGYPAYFMTILGIWYVLAGVALLAQRFPLLKEWAYSGLLFNYTGAAASHLAVGDGVATLIAPMIFTHLAARARIRWETLSQYGEMPASESNPHSCAMAVKVRESA